MRILLTGTGGQVGGALLPLLQHSDQVLAPSREEFDLSHPDELKERLARYQPDLIINPAAYTSVDRAEEERELAFRVNAEAPAIMVEWAVRNGVPLVHFSTDYVFDGSGSEPWREDSEPRPLSVYGKSKLAGERAIVAAGGAHIIVRTSWIYAASGINFLNTIANLAKEREELRIVADQIGAPTTARVIAVTLTKILSARRTELTCAFEEWGGALNIACQGETSWYGFATAIAAGLRCRGVGLNAKNIIPIETNEFPTRAKRPQNSRLNLERLFNVFGIVTPDWYEALQGELDAYSGFSLGVDGNGPWTG
ncbi:dTDP-4-dehydrorhamnose reductase [Bradyrhizobium sp. JYMT SZCCT0428]|uniref:dTDP-4-dehydrorhamnose reductase n=1 Tax=Bradyrhizobium sp. JYMT SZCCT0428 TaxID=2807673 RepID=UPI001BABB26D|nr:dTDP-4-dehydrorhamnose reductase [Bradyrhizobium sp. JYMT SZCCT0428]MBR1153683.1 dTDP-4-dehydrorhamnose reductase [Bradyrhizobium sp. JYMT SZCCT0428]